MLTVLSGNEAIARGAWEAGVRVATAYPGTPSTEIIEAAATYPEIQAQWCPNEKVALEVALGAAQSGARTLCAMKHVGLNVAADPLITGSYTGIRAGLVVVTADDPGMFSSQNEQDNRYFGLLGKIPILEPADSQEALDMVRLGFELSEEFDTPVLLRSTTRISHSVTVVRLGDRTEPDIEPGFIPNPAKHVMVPGHARGRHVVVEERMKQLTGRSNETDVNRVETGDNSLGIVTGGISYQYVKEVAGQYSVFKLGMTNPLPLDRIEQFAAGVDHMLVVEELEPIWEQAIRARGIPARGRDVLPSTGELSPDLVASAVAAVLDLPEPTVDVAPVEGLAGRPPVMCPGCPHRGVFYVLSRLKLTVMGDIGCYTLGVQPPLSALDTCLCMGAGIGQAMGLELAAGRDASRGTVAVIGDSTFVHSGITGLIEVVYNGGHCTVLILDNGTTAMTGHQHHPGTGRTASGDPATRLDLAAVCQAVGVTDLHRVDPLDLDAVTDAIRAALAHDGPSVVITERPCLLLDRSYRKPSLSINPDLCSGCGLCLGTGCPAVERDEPAERRGRSVQLMKLNRSLCAGCGFCARVCPTGAIGRGTGQ